MDVEVADAVGVGLGEEKVRKVKLWSGQLQTQRLSLKKIMRE